MKSKLLLCGFILAFVVLIANGGFAQELYRNTSKEMGFLSLDYNVGSSLKSVHKAQD